MLGAPATWRFAFFGCSRFVRPANQIVQSVGVNAGDANQNPFVIEVVIGDVVRSRIGGEQLRALVEIGADDQGFAVLMEAEEECAAHAESGSAVRRALCDIVEGKREFANGGEGDGHTSRLYLFRL
jgi:hypothetical protein